MVDPAALQMLYTAAPHTAAVEDIGITVLKVCSAYLYVYGT